MALYTRDGDNDHQDNDDEFFGSFHDDDGNNYDEVKLDGNNHNNVIICTTAAGTEMWGKMAIHEQSAIEEKFRTIGFHETFQSSQEKMMQTGFIAGYTDTYNIALEIGRMLGESAAESKLGICTTNDVDDTYLNDAAAVREVAVSVLQEKDDITEKSNRQLLEDLRDRLRSNNQTKSD